MTQLIDKDGNPIEQRHPFGLLEVEGVRLTSATPTTEPEAARPVNWERDRITPQSSAPAERR